MSGYKGLNNTCSSWFLYRFAVTTEKEDRKIFCWMFDRRVIPQSLPSDLEFHEEYSTMAGFIWPETWHVRVRNFARNISLEPSHYVLQEDLPSVDAALELCVQDLLEGVATLKARPNAVKCIPVKEFPVDLRILEQGFSEIFQASHRSREKKGASGE